MHKLLYGFAGLMLGLAGSAANAQDTVKIGIIIPYSGQFADTAIQMDNAIKLYVKQHGDTVAGKKIEFIRKDIGGVAPDIAKRLAQELIVRDHADIIAGFALTPNALAAGDVSAEAKKFMVVMNAATRSSPRNLRISPAHRPQRRNSIRRSGLGRRSTGSRPHTPWCRITVPASMRKHPSISDSRRRAAKSSARFVSRSPIRTSPPSFSEPRIQTRTPSTSGFRAAPSLLPSAKHSPSAASIPRK